jgi:hypothetical protein
MQINIQHNIDEVADSLMAISREVVPKAIRPAINDGVKKAYSLSVKYAAKEFGKKQKDIRRLKIVTRILAKKGEFSGVVYFNKYNELMTVEKFYTEADTYRPEAFAGANKSVKGRAFTFTPTRGNSTSEIWARRENSKRRIKNTWKSSKLHPMKFRRSVRNAERVAAIFAKKGERVFKKRLIHHINYHLRRAGLA